MPVSAVRAAHRAATSRIASSDGASPASVRPRDTVESALRVDPAEYQSAQGVLRRYSDGKGKGLSAGTKDSTGAWNRGLMQAHQQRLGQGSLITIYSGHNAEKDSFGAVQLKVQLKLPGSAFPSTFTLHDFGTVAANTGKKPYQYESVVKLYLSDAALEAAIEQRLPGVKVDDVLAKGLFAVACRWKSGHNWGDFDRHGVIPWESKRGKAAEAEPQVVVGLPKNQSKVELDVTVPIGPSRKKKHACLDTRQAAFMSHLEAESKSRVPLTRFAEIYAQLMTLAATSPKEAAKQKAAMQAIFGAEAGDWKIERVTKYDRKGAAAKKDPRGFVPIKPFNDVYLDTAARDLAQSFVVLRTRKVEGEKHSFTQVNVKPGPGVRDPRTNVARRAEYELIAAKEVGQSPGLLLPFFGDSADALNPYNVARDYIQGSTGKALAAQVQGRAGSKVTGFSGIASNRRFKFELTNKKTLVAFEVSLDLCATLCVDADGMPIRVDANGKPDPNGRQFAVACFAQLECEANHMAGAVGGKGTSPGSTAPISGGQVAAGGPIAAPTIHIHGLDDLKSKVFDTDPGYVQFAKVMPSFQSWLFGAGIGRVDGSMATEQKNAMGQRFAGTVSMSAAEKRLYGQELAASAEFRQSIAKPLNEAVARAESKIKEAKAKYGRLANGGPKIAEATVEAREEIWKVFGQMNPLDFIDLKKLPKP